MTAAGGPGSITASAAKADEGAFRPAMLLWVVAVGIAAAFAFVVVGTFAPDLEAGRDAQAHALSRSAVGYAGLVRLLGETGVPTAIGRGAPSPGSGGGLLVLTPPPGADPEAVKDLARSGGAVLIVAPKWLAVPSLTHPGWARIGGLLAPATVGKAVARPEIGALARASGRSAPVLTSGDDPRLPWRGQRLAFGPVERLQYQPADAGTPVLADAAGRAVLVSVGDGRLFVLTDPDLLNNHGMADAATARSALALIDLLRAGGPVRFDVTLNGLGTPRSLIRIALTPPFLAATLCALAALALAGWRSLVRFGPAARPGRAVALGKLALVDTSAALIRMAGRESAMTARYAGVVRGALAEAVGAPRDWNAEALDAWLDRLGDPTGRATSFTDLAAAAERPRASPAEALARARRLYDWKEEVMRGRR